MVNKDYHKAMRRYYVIHTCHNTYSFCKHGDKEKILTKPLISGSFEYV